MAVSMVYMTTKDKEEARRIGRQIVEERLAACVNIIEGVNSIYWWDGKVQDETEAVLIAKTKAELVPRLIERVKSLHSYTCPCVVALPVMSGNADYLQWVENETR